MKKILLAGFLSTAFLLLGYFAVNAQTVVDITNVDELRTAIKNQADGQVWNISSGNYDLAAFDDITAEGQTGWYFPITANDITINGAGVANTTIYGTGFTANGNWSTQNFVSIFGNNVVLKGMTLMPKVEPNKTIEVLGKDVTIQDVSIKPNTLTDMTEYDNVSDPNDPAWTQDSKQWGGSLYFSASGNHTIKNVDINNGGISFRYAPAGTNIAFDNVKVIDTTNIDWINAYRYSAGFNDAGNSITGSPSVIYHVNATINNLDSVLANMKDGDIIELDSDISTSKQITLNKAITFNGNNHTITPTFAKTDNSNNSAIGIQSNDVKINDLVVDGTGGTKLHGINIYLSENVALNNITLKNNANSGINVNGSTVSVNNTTLENNGWGGINVSQGSGVTATPTLTIIGTLDYTGSPKNIIWIDGKTTNDGWVVGYDAVNLAEKIPSAAESGNQVQLWFVKKPLQISVCTQSTSLKTTNLSTWDLTQTRSTGHNELVANGLHIWTEGASSTDKAAGYYNTDFYLKDLGTNTIANVMTYTTVSGATAPGAQLVVDFDNDGTVDGILVGETVYGNNWWLSNSAAQFVKDGAPNVGGGNGSNWFGSAEEWLNAFPNAKVKSIGYSLGSGVKGDFIITKISAGCTDYVFDLPPSNNIVVGGGVGGGAGSSVTVGAVLNNTINQPAPTTNTPVIGRVLGASAYQFTQNMRLGSRGVEVKALQKFLNAKGFTIAATGAGSVGNETEYFGPLTRAALIRYQEANPAILTNVGITNGKGTGNFFWSTRRFVNELLLNDSETSNLLSQ